MLSLADNMTDHFEGYQKGSKKEVEKLFTCRGRDENEFILNRKFHEFPQIFSLGKIIFIAT